jgi:indole-3-glycerol phosphate synthase
MSADLLQTVVAAARRSAEAREARVSATTLAARVPARRPQGGRFRASLSEPGIRIIAECKRRSPSKGVLRPDYDPVTIAKGYQAAGAAALSVLTEPTFFDGSLDHLAVVRQAVDTPLLRKDFIVTPYQILEAAAIGADAVLLIVAALDDRTLRSLAVVARDAGLATLVEVHDRAELTRALDAGADVVGVNSRNLRTLTVDQGVFDALGPGIPRGVVAVAESGLRTPADLARLHRLRYDAFLIGERFMTEPDPGAALDRLRGEAERVGATA